MSRRVVNRITIVSVGLAGVFAIAFLTQRACAEAWVCPRERDSHFDAFQTTEQAERTLLGRTRDNIAAEYGQPDSERFGSEYDATYWMRPRGFCVGGWYLALNFDDQGVAVEVAVLPG